MGAEKTREFSFIVKTTNDPKASHPPVTWACRVHPTNSWHEVGCPHCEWTKEQLQEALGTARYGHSLAVDYIKTLINDRVDKLPSPEDFGRMFQVTTPVALNDVSPIELKGGHERDMNLKEIVRYEIHASWAGWVFAWIVGDLICARYFLWKSERKWKRYQAHLEWARERLQDQIERDCT